VAAPGEEDEVTVVLTRAHARELGVGVDTKVWLSANRGATSVSAERRTVSAVSAVKAG
jgi:hypothetical protein